MTTPSIWITGPVARLAEYAAAAEQAGWRVSVQPLIAVESLPIEWPDPTPDWIVVTSASALPALQAHRARIQSLPAAAVGQRSAQGLVALGARLLAPAAEDSQALLADLGRRPLPGGRVLWPHGSASRLLEKGLARLGALVLPRLAYRHRQPELPAGAQADLTFVTSPSAVDALADCPVPEGGWRVLAIGPTTAQACQDQARRLGPGWLRELTILSQPTLAAFTQALSQRNP